jgi:hypothetical protein
VTHGGLLARLMYSARRLLKRVLRRAGIVTGPESRSPRRVKAD